MPLVNTAQMHVYTYTLDIRLIATRRCSVYSLSESVFGKSKVNQAGFVKTSVKQLAPSFISEAN